MVGEYTPQMKMDEALYEEITVRDENHTPKTTWDESRRINQINDIDYSMNDNVSDNEENCTSAVPSDSFDIYEIIPAERQHQKTPEPVITSRTSSISSNDEHQLRNHVMAKPRSCSSASSGCDSDENNVQGAWRRGLSCSTPDISTTQYAEIVSSTNITEYLPSRPTRESDNPILKIGFASSSNWSNKHSHHLHQKQSEHQVEGSNSLKSTTRRFGPLYENTPTKSPNQSPKLSPNQSPCCVRNQSGRFYENVEFPFTSDSDCESRRSSISVERQSLSSEGSSKESECISSVAYENVPCEERPRTKSKPLDIVYSDLDFSEHNKRRTIERCVSVPLGEKSSPFLPSPASNSLPPLTKPRPLPPKKDVVSSRPKSMVVSNSCNAQLGFHIAKFVGVVVVQRSNELVLQACMQDLLRKTHEENFKLLSVNLEVNNEFLRISTNCSPWEVILSCDINHIGQVSLYEQDANVIGLISCTPRQDAQCYVVRTTEAPSILQAIKTVFKLPDPRPKGFRRVNCAFLGPDNWLEDTEVTSTFNDVIYLGLHRIKKSLLSVKDSIQDILNKSNPKDFKTVSVKVQCTEIHILDSDNETTLAKHLVPWVVSMGVFEKDPRVFGYIVTEARQGKKTLMFCHAFRCGRVTSAASVTETIRIASQTAYSARRDSVGSIRSRRGSQASRTSTLSLSSISSDNELNEEEFEENSTVDDFQKETKSKRIRNLPVFRKLSKKESSKNISSSKFYDSEAAGRNNSNSSFEDFVVVPTEIVEEKVYNFQAIYLCSTVVNPPLRPKHVRDCAKQYQKQNEKLQKRLGKTQPKNDVKMDVGADGVAMCDTLRPQNNQRFFPFSDIHLIKSHPDYPDYFAFSTVVTGDTKHKCHLFKQTDKYSCGEIIKAFESFI